ncbi:hypothetical protein CH361_18905 [Leptospira brenneri]|nr:hypothetical protein CH361_18905 [Leptospira brenneri]
MAKIYNMITKIQILYIIFKRSYFFLLFTLVLIPNCIKTEKEACFHDIQREDGPTTYECLILSLYFQNTLNDPSISESQKENFIHQQTLIRPLCDTYLQSEKCKAKSNSKFTIRS